MGIVYALSRDRRLLFDKVRNRDFRGLLSVLKVMFEPKTDYYIACYPLGFASFVAQDRMLSLGYLYACRELTKACSIGYHAKFLGLRILLVKLGLGGSLVRHMLRNDTLYVNSDSGLVVLASLILDGSVNDRRIEAFCRQALSESQFYNYCGMDCIRSLEELARERELQININRWCPDGYVWCMLGSSVVYISELNRGYAIGSGNEIVGVSFSPLRTKMCLTVKQRGFDEPIRYAVVLQTGRYYTLDVRSFVGSDIGMLGVKTYKGSASHVKRLAVYR